METRALIEAKNNLFMAKLTYDKLVQTVFRDRKLAAIPDYKESEIQLEKELGVYMRAWYAEKKKKGVETFVICIGTSGQIEQQVPKVAAESNKQIAVLNIDPNFHLTVSHPLQDEFVDVDYASARLSYKPNTSSASALISIVKDVIHSGKQVTIITHCEPCFMFEVAEILTPYLGHLGNQLALVDAYEIWAPAFVMTKQNLEATADVKKATKDRMFEIVDSYMRPGVRKSSDQLTIVPSINDLTLAQLFPLKATSTLASNATQTHISELIRHRNEWWQQQNVELKSYQALVRSQRSP